MKWWQCARCGERLRFVAGRVWCPRPTCKFEATLPKPRTDEDTAGF